MQRKVLGVHIVAGNQRAPEPDIGLWRAWPPERQESLALAFHRRFELTQG